MVHHRTMILHNTTFRHFLVDINLSLLQRYLHNYMLCKFTALSMRLINFSDFLIGISYNFSSKYFNHHFKLTFLRTGKLLNFQIFATTYLLYVSNYITTYTTRNTQIPITYATKLQHISKKNLSLYTMF